MKQPALHHFGKLVDDCTTPGERRADGIAPGHPNGIQLSQNVFLLLISTLNFRGVDDNAGIVGQLRRGGFDGPVIREVPLASSAVDWDLFGDGELYVRQFGHPVAFGVPKGTVIDGKVPAHANHFALILRCCARKISPNGWLYWNNEPEAVKNQSQHVRWLQFHLNEAEDDLEFDGESCPLRQEGWSDEERICELPADVRMNQTFVQPVPYTASADEWVVCNHFLRMHEDTSVDRSKGAAILPKRISLAVLRFQFNSVAKRYEWVQTSREFGEGHFEASILPYRGDWIVLARSMIGEDRSKSDPMAPPAWARFEDPFSKEICLQPLAEKGCSRAPVSAFLSPDGKVRWMSGNKLASPHGQGRNPLYLFEADVENGFRTVHTEVVFDVKTSGLPIQASSLVDMGKLLPHCGGREQILVHRVRTVALRQAEADMGGAAAVLTDGDFSSTAIYYAKLDYQEDLPATWNFASQV